MEFRNNIHSFIGKKIKVFNIVLITWVSKEITKWDTINRVTVSKMDHTKLSDPVSRKDGFRPNVHWMDVYTVTLLMHKETVSETKGHFEPEP